LAENLKIEEYSIKYMEEFLSQKKNSYEKVWRNNLRI
jgi:hypothetical protein